MEECSSQAAFSKLCAPLTLDSSIPVFGVCLGYPKPHTPESYVSEKANCKS